MTIVIETGGRPSTGARRLARALGIKRLRGDGSRYAPREGDCVINWGCTQRRFPSGIYINEPGYVNIAGSKFNSLRMMRNAEVQVPEFTTHTHDVDRWLEEGSPVISRTVDRGHGGIGMTIMHPGPEPIITLAPLYVKYIPKKYEYRVHVIGGVAVDTQMKRRRNNLDRDNVNYQIRVASNGWVYCRGGVVAPQQITDQALLAVQALRLDFGAVDIGYTLRTERATVYEVNTAPGIEGLTVNLYAENLRRIINERRNA